MSRVDELLDRHQRKNTMLVRQTLLILKEKFYTSMIRKAENNPYQTEHDELFAAIAKGEYKFADAENGAKSTMTSILGRMATYSGQVIEWDKAINSGLDLQPKVYDWDAPPPVVPNADGYYALAVPGVTTYFA